MDEQLAYEIGIEGYTYLYPLVLMELTREQMTNVVSPGDRPGRGPADVFTHVRAFPPAGFRDVVRPNFDTLYSVAWLDVSTEPRIVTVPSAGDNYYLLPIYDMWGEVFACPGVRTTGSDALSLAVCPPGWTGQLPAGIRRYDCPTRTAWIIGRTEASVATYEHVRAFQDGMAITRLSDWGRPPRPVQGRVDPAIDADTPPLRQVFAMDAAAFFGLGARLLAEHGAHAQDYPTLDRLAQVGFSAGAPFDLAAAGPAVQAGFARAVPVAQKRITDFQVRMGHRANGWLMNVEVMGNYGTWYLKRATVELIGLGANLSDDAVYPMVYVDAHGEPFDGRRSYVWHMEKDQVPPANAFWSLTLYDGEGFQVANDLDRFAIGDRDALAFNEDGSLDIWIGHERPAAGTSNWLPAPGGPFNLAARLYWPKPQVLDGTWVPQPVRRVG